MTKRRRKLFVVMLNVREEELRGVDVQMYSNNG